MIGKTEVFINEKWQDISACSNVFVRADDDGKFFIKSNGVSLKFVRITFECSLADENTAVLSDEWERAYGDMEWTRPDYSRIMPWYFAASCGGRVYCFGVKNQPNAFCSWQMGGGKITLNIDIRNGSDGILLGENELEACCMVSAEYDCDEFSALSDFCGKMCDKPRLPNHTVYGGNDWYCNYGDNSYEKIITHTKRIVECSPGGAQKPYMVIDDGWELCHHDERFTVSEEEREKYYFNGGPWRYCNSNFGDMKKLADEITSLGAVPGIWFRPLWTIEKVPSSAVLKRDGIKTTLDPSSKEALEIIANDVKTIRNWGYKLIKHDFSTFDIFGKWGFEAGKGDFDVHFADKTKTTAQIIKNFYETLRNAAGDDVLLMGCNTISHLSAGIFELQRTGDDTSGIEWERTKKYGINTLAFRMTQHNKLYCADADCVGITKHISWDINRKWLDVLSKSATALFVSIAEDAYTDEVKKDVSAAFERAAVNMEASRAADWMKNPLPAKWVSAFGEDEYCWEN